MIIFSATVRSNSIFGEGGDAYDWNVALYELLNEPRFIIMVRIDQQEKVLNSDLVKVHFKYSSNIVENCLRSQSGSFRAPACYVRF